jgi:hypothetical protein
VFMLKTPMTRVMARAMCTIRVFISISSINQFVIPPLGGIFSHRFIA